MSKGIPTDAQIREKMEEMTQVFHFKTMSTEQFVAVLSDKFNGVVDLTSKKKYIETTIGEIIDSVDCDDDDQPAAREEEESISEANIADHATVSSNDEAIMITAQNSAMYDRGNTFALHAALWKSFLGG